MRIDQHAQHTKRLVVFDETHSAHVGGEIVNKINIGHRALTVVLVAQIELQVLHFREHLKPFIKWFHIHRANFVTLPKQIGHQMAANKAASAADHDFLGSHSRTESR